MIGHNLRMPLVYVAVFNHKDEHHIRTVTSPTVVINNKAKRRQELPIFHLQALPNKLITGMCKYMASLRRLESTQ